jgi:uncharacterized membrane protein YozB (DUF420 family)
VFCRILPVLALLFLCSFLDRTNVGNAKTYGLEASLKMTYFQYDTGLTVYYATYIARHVVLTDIAVETLANGRAVRSPAILS